MALLEYDNHEQTNSINLLNSGRVIGKNISHIVSYLNEVEEFVVKDLSKKKGETDGSE